MLQSDMALKDVAAAIQMFGKAVIVHTMSSGTYNPATGVSAITDVPYTTRAVVHSYNDALVDGTRIQKNDRKILLSCKSSLWSPSVPTLKQGDQVEDAARTVRYQIVGLDEIEMQGVMIGYIIQGRQL